MYYIAVYSLRVFHVSPNKFIRLSYRLSIFFADFVQEEFEQQAVVVTVDFDCWLYDPC